MSGFFLKTFFYTKFLEYSTCFKDILTPILKTTMKSNVKCKKFCYSINLNFLMHILVYYITSDFQILINMLYAHLL